MDCKQWGMVTVTEGDHLAKTCPLLQDSVLDLEWRGLAPASQEALGWILLQRMGLISLPFKTAGDLELVVFFPAVFPVSTVELVVLFGMLAD